jgi:hypothetical protein
MAMLYLDGHAEKLPEGGMFHGRSLTRSRSYASVVEAEELSSTLHSGNGLGAFPCVSFRIVGSSDPFQARVAEFLIGSRSHVGRKGTAPAALLGGRFLLHLLN